MPRERRESRESTASTAEFAQEGTQLYPRNTVRSPSLYCEVRERERTSEVPGRRERPQAGASSTAHPPRCLQGELYSTNRLNSGLGGEKTLRPQLVAENQKSR
jgi:hypothetical protein